MTELKQNKLLELYKDCVLLLLTLLITVVVSTILLIMFTGDRATGMTYGLFCGLLFTLCFFYYLRTYFVLWVSIIHGILTSALTALVVSLVAWIFSETAFIKMNYGYIFFLTTIPILFALNKQLIDNLAKRLNAPKRQGKRLEIL